MPRSACANMAIACAWYAIGAVGVLHLVNREYDAISQPMSYYAVGAYGWLMTTAILAFAASVLALAFALEYGTAPWSRASRAFLLGAGVCLVIASVFPTDVTANNLPITIAGTIHVAASYLASPCLVAAALLLSRQYGLAYALALASWGALVVLVVVNHLDLRVGGIGQRIFLALIALWMLVTAFRLRRSTLAA